MPGARALILDCDGVLADTERDGHLVAFNQTFAEFGLPAHWTLDDYRVKLRTGGGKERLASLLTPEFVAAAGLPADPAAQQASVAAWHKRKTAIYTQLVASGAVPPRSGVARIVGDALAAGWQVAVASTSAEPSVVATLERAVGAEQARAVKVFAGDIVPRKKPAPDIYLAAVDWLGLPAGQVVVIEDSRNGLLAAAGAGLATVITVNDLTKDEDFSEAALVVSALGDPGGERAVVLANRAGITGGDWITLTDLAHVMPGDHGEPEPDQPEPDQPEPDQPEPDQPEPDQPEQSAAQRGAPMPKATLGDVEHVVHTIATVAVENEKYFGDLDAVVGDGDFGYSMARGFELVLTGWDGFDRTDIGTFLKKVAVMITSRIGGTSGPIWGTAFLRAGAAAGTATELDGEQVVAMLWAAINGIKARGQSDVGDKTLLDALVPATESIERSVAAGLDAPGTMRAAAGVARERAEATRPMLAKRGRASYTGERSIGTLDAGAVAVAVMFEALAGLSQEPTAKS
jgi:dihydroxyacetone kinase phosphoprotein-dependent L subunit